MNYVQYLNLQLLEHLSKKPHVIFGQNISAGSCLGGLTRGMETLSECHTINTPNSENTLVGLGSGLLLKDVSSVFFVKQLDFLLLSLDQIVNTYNILLHSGLSSSFIIFPITVDSGYEGPQASLNTLDDFASISNINVFSITNEVDTPSVLTSCFSTPGIHMVSTGQRLFKQPLLSASLTYKHDSSSFFQYTQGHSVSIICFNHTYPEGAEIHNQLLDKNISSALFTYNLHSGENLSALFNQLPRSEVFIILDDSKSKNKLSNTATLEVRLRNPGSHVRHIAREYGLDSLKPSEDKLPLCIEEVVNDVLRHIKH